MPGFVRGWGRRPAGLPSKIMFRSWYDGLPIWRVILEQMEAITGIDTFDGQTRLAGSGWDC